MHLYPSVRSRGGGCDNRVSEPVADEEPITFTEAPIIYPNSTHGHKGDLTQSKVKPSGAKYFCLVGTLNPEGTELAYTYHKYDLNIPKGLIKKAHKSGKPDRWMRILFGNRNATGRTEADPMPGGSGASVRTVRCMLPPSDKVLQEVGKQFSRFSPESWAYQNQDQPQQATKSGGGDQAEGYTCVTWSVTEVCPPGEQANPYDATQDNCTIISYDYCKEYAFVDEDPGDGSTGGSTGGNSGDACQPDSSGGSGPGLTDPNGVPVSCNAEGDPCEQVEELENDTTWVGKLEELLEAANNKNYETGYLLYSHIGGGYAYNYGEGSANEPDMSINTSLPISGYIHSHYSGQYSIFTATDILTIYQTYQAGNIKNLSTFTGGVVTAEGTSYLLKIENKQKFLNFAQQNLKNQIDFNKFASDYNLNRTAYVIPYGEEVGGAFALLDLLKSKNSGIKIFKGNADFDDWQAIESDDNSDQILNTDCN